MKPTKWLVGVFLLISLGGGYAYWQWTSNAAPLPSLDEQLLHSEKVLTPGDLGVTKYVLKAQPRKNHVAKMHCESHYDGQLVQSVTSYIYTGGELHYEPVLLINKHQWALLGTPRKGKPDFCNNYLVRTGGLSHEFDHLHFQRSSHHYSEASAQLGSSGISTHTHSASFEFNEHWKGEGKTFTITADLSVIPYNEAKQAHPELPEIKEGGGWSWQTGDWGPAALEFNQSMETVNALPGDKPDQSSESR